MNIENKVAIVTGGCSGLGNATVQSLAAKGVKVAIFDINDEQGAAIVNELGSDKAMFEKVDVRNAQSVEDAVARVVEKIWCAAYLCELCGHRPSQAYPRPRRQFHAVGKLQQRH